MPEGDRLVLARTIYTVKDTQLAAMSDKVERKIQDAVYQLGRQARDMARSLVPVKTGALKASIYVSRGARDASDKAGSASAPFTKQSSVGYLRAVRAAVIKSGADKKELKGGRLDLRDKLDLVEPNTQRPYKGSGFSSSISEIEKIKYRAYASPSSLLKRDEDYEGGGDVQSIMQLGHAGPESFFVTVGAGAFYAGYVEFGHNTPGGFVKERPFLRPAIKWAQDQLPVVIAEALRQGMAK